MRLYMHACISCIVRSERYNNIIEDGVGVKQISTLQLNGVPV